ncbi:MAG: hypothetical protein LBP22_17010 [Deltaproteobacteria bacterium]|nr:hypothetical protein [Deltaproteobacteria bacterium]
MGAIPLGLEGDSFQPYVFLVEHDTNTGNVDSIIFSYYKVRPDGSIKSGHGPGGPPILDLDQFDAVLDKLVSLGIMKR